MTHALPPLPFEMDALAPHISRQTLEFHYGKHHQAYVTNLNNLLQNHALAGAPLEDVIQASATDSAMTPIFNNAAQVWNHTFYWHCLSPQGGGAPSAFLTGALERAFGSVQAFKDQFKQAAVSQFGSGWAWLVLDTDGALKITKTGNADLPMTKGQKALLTCDVWEHAYYLDYQNRRPDYVDMFLTSLINWQSIEERLA